MFPRTLKAYGTRAWPKYRRSPHLTCVSYPFHLTCAVLETNHSNKRSVRMNESCMIKDEHSEDSQDLDPYLMHKMDMADRMLFNYPKLMEKITEPKKSIN